MHLFIHYENITGDTLRVFLALTQSDGLVNSNLIEKKNVER